MAMLVQTVKEKFNPPKPTTDLFTGRTILVTGTNTGIGLDAAKKIAALRPEKLIITARNAAKAQETKDTIQAWLKHSSKVEKPAEIIAMSLDMGNFSAVKAFADELKSRFSTLDAAILNAGLSTGKYTASPDGWEQTLQVNTLSTAYLGLLLLDLLKKTSDTKGSPTHLTMVSSGLSVTATPGRFEKHYASKTPLKDMSQRDAFPSGWDRYQESKVFLEYAMRHMAQLPSIQSETGPLVIVNTVCPGLCHSNLAREATQNFFVAILAWIAFTLLARTTEQGANQYLSAVNTDVSSNGELWRNDRNCPMGKCLHTTQIQQIADNVPPGPMQKTEAAQKFGDKVWDEMRTLFLDIDPKLRPVLTS